MRLAISCLVASRMVESKSTTSKVNCALAHASPKESAHSICIRTVSYYPLFKGQLISKCPFGVKSSSKTQRKFFQDFCPSL